MPLKFRDLSLPEALLRAVDDLGFETPTPIQAEALPHLLDGLDVAGQAQTGTGKTACFLLAVLNRLVSSERPSGGRPRALVVAPTRELAMQIAEDGVGLAAHTDMGISLAYGGTNWERQAKGITDGTDIVVGTPGRLIDYLKRGVLRLDRVEVLVIDEADRMFDMGFVRDITYLIRACPPKQKRQSLLFSATLSQQVMQLAWRHMRDPVEIAVEPDNVVVDLIEQSLFHVASHEKVPLMLGLLAREQPKRAIIFVNTKRWGEELAWRLNRNGHHAAYISGDLPQNKRQRIIQAAKEGKIDLLVATDVASRGLHVEDITHVFNYDLPEDCEDYVHRIGRTARAGAHGRAISLACENFVYGLPAIEKYIGRKVPVGFADEGLFAEDRGGRFIRRKKVYCGWPPEEAEAAREEPHRAERGGRRGDDRRRDDRRRDGGPPRKKRERRRRDGDGPKPAAGAAPQSTKPSGGPPAANAAASGESGAPTSGRSRRKRQRRRIGDGNGM